MSDDKQTNLTDDLLADPFSTATDATAEPNIPEATTAKPKLNPEQEAKARDLASKLMSQKVKPCLITVPMLKSSLASFPKIC